MSALNMGFAQLQVVPVMTGFNKTIKQELGSAFPQLGKAAGADFGKGVVSGFAGEKKSIESEVKALEKNLASAQDKLKAAKEANSRASEKEIDALKKLEIAELKLNETRESGKAKASQLATAEENVRQKQLALKKAQDDSHRSAVTLEAATEDLSVANDKLKVSADKANKELADTSSSDKAKKGLKSVKDQAANTQGGLGKLGDFMKGAFAGAIAAVSFGAVIGQMKEVIQLAGDYQQSVGAIDSIFKDQAGKMHSKADTAAVDVGLNKNEFNELGSVLGAQLKNAGTPMDELSDKTSNLITLGADLSSMFGGTTKEAIEAVSSALKGEMDPIEKYGITLSAAALEAEALSKGLIKPIVDADLVADATTKMQVAQKKHNETVAKYGKDSMEAAKSQVALNAAERAFDKATAGKIPKLEGEAKALAVQSALYAQSADAQGNFAKESDTLQGQQQRLNAEVANMKIAAGTAFLPAMTKIVEVIRATVIPALQNMGQWISDNQAWLKPLAVTIAATAGAFLAFKGIAAMILGIHTAVGFFKDGFKALNIVMKANVFVLIASAIAALVVGFIYLWKTNEGFRNFFIGMWTAISGFFVGIWNNGIKPVFAAIGNFITNTLVPIFQWFYSNVILPVFNAIKVVIAVVITAVMLYIKMWIAIWKNVLAPAILFVWNKVLKPTFQALGTFFKWVWETLLRPAFNALKLAFQAVGNAIKSAWNTLLKPVFNVVGTFMRDTVAPMFQRAVDKIKSVWSSIKGAFKATWDWVSEKVFTPVKTLITETIPNAFKSGVDSIKGFWDKLGGIARKPINFVIETVYGGLRNTFNKVADTLGLPENFRLPKVDKIKEFATGGYTGPGAKYQEAGVVHAGEYVIRKEATSRLRRTIGLDGLDHLNQYGTFPGFAKGGFVRPVNGGRYTGRFGDSRGRYPHAGLDIAIGENTPVHAPLDGTVRVAGWNAVAGRSGIGVLIDHANGISTYQGHLNRALVKAGDIVKANQQIALSGNTGKSTGPHVHSEVWINGKPVDPFNYINSGIMPTGGSGGGWNPLQGLFDLKDKFVGQFTEKFGSGNMLSQIASGALGKLVNGPIDWIKEKAAALGDVGQDIWGNTKDFFNGKDSEVQAAVRGVANGYGWGSGRHWDSLSKIINKESSWNPNAANPRSSARGLFQKMTSIHGPLESTPEGQARWGLNYIHERYGDPEKAWQFHKSHGYYSKGGYVGKVYDQGGILPPGQLQMVSNLSRKPEYIMTNEQWKNVEAISRQGASTGDIYNLSFQKPTTSPDEFIGAINHQVRINRRGGR